MKSEVSQKGYLHENYHYFHLHDTAGQEHSFHFHEFDKVVLLLSGKVSYTVEDITYDLKPWSLLLVHHHAIHKANIDISEPYNRVILYLDGSYFERTMPSAGLMDCFKAADRPEHCLILPDQEQRTDLERCLKAFEEAQKDSRHGADVIRDAIIIQLLALINRITLSGEESREAERYYDRKIQKALSYINENLASDLSVELLAEKVFLSRYHFMRLFKTQTGSTVHSYIRQKRLLSAARMIREGIPAGQAALECGFNDYSVFNRAFRESFGIRPIDLKK